MDFLGGILGFQRKDLCTSSVSGLDFSTFVTSWFLGSCHLAVCCGSHGPFIEGFYWFLPSRLSRHDDFHGCISLLDGKYVFFPPDLRWWFWSLPDLFQKFVRTKQTYIAGRVHHQSLLELWRCFGCHGLADSDQGTHSYQFDATSISLQSSANLQDICEMVGRAPLEIHPEVQCSRSSRSSRFGFSSSVVGTPSNQKYTCHKPCKDVYRYFTD